MVAVKRISHAAKEHVREHDARTPNIHGRPHGGACELIREKHLRSPPPRGAHKRGELLPRGSLFHDAKVGNFYILVTVE